MSSQQSKENLHKIEEEEDSLLASTITDLFSFTEEYSDGISISSSRNNLSNLPDHVIDGAQRSSLKPSLSTPCLIDDSSITLTVTKHAVGDLGIILKNSHGIGAPVVKEVVISSPAHKAGILSGDRLLEVNGHILTGHNPSEVLQRFKSATGLIKVLLRRNHPRKRCDSPGMSTQLPGATMPLDDAAHRPRSSTVAGWSRNKVSSRRSTLTHAPRGVGNGKVQGNHVDGGKGPAKRVIAMEVSAMCSCWFSRKVKRRGIKREVKLTWLRRSLARLLLQSFTSIFFPRAGKIFSVPLATMEPLPKNQSPNWNHDLKPGRQSRRPKRTVAKRCKKKTKTGTLRLSEKCKTLCTYCTSKVFAQTKKTSA